MKTINNTLAAIQPTLESVQLNQVISQLTELADYEIIAIHNDYCEANNDSYNHIIDNDNEAIDSMFDSPSDAIRAATFGNYNSSHNYFILDGYANLVSFNYASDDNSPIDVSELAEWLVNEDKLADYDITVTTLDDMLDSIEDSIADDNNILYRMCDCLSIEYDESSDIDNLIKECMIEVSSYNYNKLKGLLEYLNINYQ